MKKSKIYIARKLNNSVKGIRADMPWINIPQWTFAGWPYKRLTEFQARIFKIYFNYWLTHNKPPGTNTIRTIYYNVYYHVLNRMTIYETLKRLYMNGYLYIYDNRNHLKCSRSGIISAIWQGKLKRTTNIYKALASINPIYVRKYFSLFTEKDRIYPFKEFHPEALKKTNEKIKKAQE